MRKGNTMQLLNMRCPSCGASVAHRLGGRIVTCEYCGSRIVLEGENLDEFLKDMAESVEEDEFSGLSMPRFAEQVCREFLDNTDHRNTFKDTPKIRRGLEVKDGETVYLIHDDTMLNNGKNGFAVTNRGIYCRSFGGDADFIDWETFAKLEAPKESDSYIACGKRNVCYYTDSRDVRSEQLMPLFQRLYRHAVSTNS